MSESEKVSDNACQDSNRGISESINFEEFDKENTFPGLSNGRSPITHSLPPQLSKKSTALGLLGTQSHNTTGSHLCEMYLKSIRNMCDTLT